MVSGVQLAADAVIGDFRLVRERGRGGMGVVWQVEQLSLGRSVVLKLLPRQVNETKGRIERLHREAEAGGLPSRLR